MTELCRAKDVPVGRLAYIDGWLAERIDEKGMIRFLKGIGSIHICRRNRERNKLMRYFRNKARFRIPFLLEAIQAKQPNRMNTSIAWLPPAAAVDTVTTDGTWN